MPEELWTEVHNIVQKAATQSIPKKNAKRLSEEDLQIAEKRREAKGKGKGKINPSECESWTIKKAEH